MVIFYIWMFLILNYLKDFEVCILKLFFVRLIIIGWIFIIGFGGVFILGVDIEIDR